MVEFREEKKGNNGKLHYVTGLRGECHYGRPAAAIKPPRPEARSNESVWPGDLASVEKKLSPFPRKSVYSKM
jgi:hypothetical protein